jgi:hypothetical protein
MTLKQFDDAMYQASELDADGVYAEAEHLRSDAMDNSGVRYVSNGWMHPGAAGRFFSPQDALEAAARRTEKSQPQGESHG